MILVIYCGILLSGYGFYNLLCYFSVLPTEKTGRNMVKGVGRGQYHCCNALMVIMAEKIVKKWELEWNCTDKMKDILRYNKIYYAATVYCISLILTAMCGLFLCVPLLFWDIRWFLVMVAGGMVAILVDPVLLFRRYSSQISSVTPAVSSGKKGKRQAERRSIVFLGSFFLCQMILIILMLT